MPSSAAVSAAPRTRVTPDTSATPTLPAGSTAVVYCEGMFGEQDGKTANGLVRHSEKYRILSVIDSRQAPADAGTVLDGVANGIPVLPDLAEAVRRAGFVPDYLICGLAPADGLLSPTQRVVLLDGIARGMHIINGLHEFLNDDAEFVGGGRDRRRSPSPMYADRRQRSDLHLFSGPDLRRHMSRGSRSWVRTARSGSAPPPPCWSRR